MNLQNLTYAGKRKNWKFERFLTSHKEQCIVLEGLTKYGYNGLDKRTKVSRLMDGVKLDSLNTVKSRILADSDFCKDFYKCVKLCKDFLKQYARTKSKTRRVSEVSSGGRGRSGGEKVED